MDKKYIGKTIALPKSVAERLDKERQILEMELGFEVSLSDTIASMLKRVEDSRNK